MTYEEHLDEVSTLLTEIYTLSDAAAIEMVMRAQADDFFSAHDDDPTLCTQERAEPMPVPSSKATSRPANRRAAPSPHARPGQARRGTFASRLLSSSSSSETSRARSARRSSLFLIS